VQVAYKGAMVEEKNIITFQPLITSETAKTEYFKPFYFPFQR